MKKQDIKELQTKSKDELKKQLLEAREELGKIEMDLVLRKETKTSSKKEKKKLIARILTFLAQKEEVKVA